MEEKKDILIFGKQEVNSSEKRVTHSRKEGGVKDETDLISIKLNKGVIIKLQKRNNVNYDIIKTLNDIVKLDINIPDLIHSFHPPLYKDFITSKGQINTIIEIGNIVITKRKFIDNKEDIPREVIDLYFKSLNNMTVIVAILNDNDFYVANRLELCK